MGRYRPRSSTTAIIKNSKSSLPHRISNMSQDDGLQCDYTPFNLKASDDNAVDYLSTGNTHSPGLRKECLDKFCTDLGYRNLIYLKDLCTTSAHTGFDTTDGCFNGKGFKIIKATIVLLLQQHIIDNKLREECKGCATDHPSQLQHSCLFEPAAYYFDSRFDELCRKLFKPNLQTIIDFTLRFNDQQHSEDSRNHRRYPVRIKRRTIHRRKAARNQGKAAGRFLQESRLRCRGSLAKQRVRPRSVIMGTVCSGINFFRDISFSPRYKEQMTEMMLTVIEHECDPEKDYKGQTRRIKKSQETNGRCKRSDPLMARID